MALITRSLRSSTPRVILTQTSSSVRCFSAAVEKRAFRRSLDALDEIVDANPDLDPKEVSERFTDLYPSAIIASQPNDKDAVLLPRAVHTYGSSQTPFWAGPFYFTSGDDWDQSWFGASARGPWKRLFQMGMVVGGWFVMRGSGTWALYNGESITLEMSKNWPSPQDKPIPPVTLPAAK